jgi:hypothetical protein
VVQGVAIDHEGGGPNDAEQLDTVTDGGAAPYPSLVGTARSFNRR